MYVHLGACVSVAGGAGEWGRSIETRCDKYMNYTVNIHSWYCLVSLSRVYLITRDVYGSHMSLAVCVDSSFKKRFRNSKSAMGGKCQRKRIVRVNMCDDPYANPLCRMPISFCLKNNQYSLEPKTNDESPLGYSRQVLTYRLFALA